MGGVGGVACLVRITSLTFLLAGLLYLLFEARQSWRGRVRGAAIALLALGMLAGPFLVNCWRTYGDPLYAINVHADIYRATEGQAVAVGTGQTAREYIELQIRAHPARTLDTFLLGMTEYPFANKWVGFEPWLHSAGTWISWAALAGLVLMAGSVAGRLVLVILAASLIPYALTWRLIADWRFTEHAYPFFLIAAALALTQAISALSSATWRPRGGPSPSPRRIGFWVGLGGSIAVVWIVATRVMPVLIFDPRVRHDPVWGPRHVVHRTGLVEPT